MPKLLIPALIAVVLLLQAPPAQAATRDLTDPVGDVMTATFDSDGESVKYNREGGAEGDITFARLQHTATQVVFYVRYRQLSVPRQYRDFIYEFEGNNHETASVDIATRHGKPQGDRFIDSSGGRCTLSSHINYAGDSISMRMPRSCLRRAKYVRLMHVTVETRARPDGSGKNYYDSPTRDGGTVNQVLNSVTPWTVTG